MVTLRGELLYSGPVVGWFSLFQSPPEKLKNGVFMGRACRASGKLNNAAPSRLGRISRSGRALPRGRVA